MPAEARSVLIYGGTFDPPHRAHVELPPAACDALGIDWLVYVPAARNPLKSDGPRATDADRLDMLRVALAGAGRTSISTIELDRAGPSYTIETLKAFQEKLGSRTTMRLLIGADQAASFHRWREPREIIRLAPPAVMLRTPMESEAALMDALRPHWSAAELGAWRSAIVPLPIIDVAATDLRAGVAENQSNPQIPPGVEQIIRMRGLYRA